MDTKTTLQITLQEQVEVLEKDLPFPETLSHRVDGGARAWCTLLGGVLMATVTFGYVNAFGVYQDIYTRSQAATASNVSWIGSTQLFFLFAMGLPAGKLLDMGYLRQTNLVGSLICLFVYLSQGVGLGVGAGLLYVPAVAVQAHHWKRRRAFAMGVVVTGSSLGGIIFPIMLNRLFQSSVGFEWGVRASAFVVLGLLIMANLLMSDNPSVKGGGEKPVLKNILTDIPFMLSSFGVFVITWGIFFPYFYVQLFAVLHGVDPSIAFYSLAIMNAAGLPGRVLPGILADRFGPFNIIVPVLLVNAALIFALFGVSAEGGIVAFVVFYGAFSGAFMTLWAPCAAALAVHPNEVGIRFGVGYFMSAFGTLIGAPIDGALLGKSFLWSKPIIFSGASIFQNYEGFR
ncbi:hypothetical protein CCMSSC00406_0005252 [Pleurotus cornucopiae]|uniref:Uncharacterized protein n=1 Tax=Pleurotus cornucopiae TaxID=5321 RepID=A0ACB7II03_PLECO|nr:hypothetical protein CCMSSC00406_0005252 [Pleurotus cornucopiae]